MAEENIAAIEPKGIENNRVTTDEQMTEMQQQALARAKARIALVGDKATKTGVKA